MKGSNRPRQHQEGAALFVAVLILALMAGGVLILGLWPAPLVELMSASVENLVLQVTQSKL